MKRLRVALAALTTLLLVAAPSVAHADVNDFAVTDFTADYYLSQSDPQGTLTVDERVTGVFTSQNHGILRAIPEKYNGQPQHIEIASIQLDGQDEPYTTYTSNGNEVLKIGNANSIITGKHTFSIDYRVQNVIRFTDNHDELDWNTNGTQWQQPFYSITARLHLPNSLVKSLGGTACYTGQQGSLSHDCTVTTRGNQTTFQTTRTLQAGENMTFVGNFPVGTFQKPTALDWWKDHAALILEAALIPLGVFAFAYTSWRKNGKDIKGRGTIVPEYTPPEGIRAAEADVINNYKLGNNAISATIIDLAIRKYLKIIEGESDGVLGMGKHKTYILQRLTPPANDALKPYEQEIVTGLFPAGDTTLISDLKNNFYVTSQSIQKSIPISLTIAGYFPKNPKRASNAFHIVGFVVLFVTIFIGQLHSGLFIGGALAGIILIIFGILMPRRTQKGQDAKDDLAGLKLYMDVAEKDRIAMLQSASTPYAAKTDALQQTVELFEKLLPFAMILGVEKSWAKQFENIYTSPPDWYSGNWTAFNAGYLVVSLNESMSAMNSSFAAPSSSGAGSGGGFSGGGGGGGGGGGW